MSRMERSMGIVCQGRRTGRTRALNMHACMWFMHGAEWAGGYDVRKPATASLLSWEPAFSLDDRKKMLPRFWYTAWAAAMTGRRHYTSTSTSK